MTLSELAQSLNLQFKGAAQIPVKGLRDIERLPAGQNLEEGYVYFIETPAVLKRHPQAGEHGVILTTAALADRFKTALIGDAATLRLTFIQLLKRFDMVPRFKPGVSPDAKVHPSAKVAASASVLEGAVIMEGAAVGERCVVYPNVVIEPYAQVGEGTVLYPCVVVGHHCVVGKNVIVHAGSVIGSDGFGFYDHATGRHKVPQIGNVVIEDHVELGAGCTIDRATIDTTRIATQTKLDNQVHIGHNCQIGRYGYIAGNTCFGGSVVMEDGVMLSGNVVVKDHLRLAKGTIVMGATAIAQDTEPKTAYFGVPGKPARQMHRMNAALERLPELLNRVKELEAKLGIETPAGA